ncbi:G2/mitotic-specific cyclin-4 [Hirsutella rhossiliensis]|uniref:G2/mitotic-specific cyclin-4 n=1 Tax=Hirsutella rhossiliensis TaxID=111463 RepID=A0A9P8MYY4_9HYPO|nr:G2/mitotic-specific cyclin-4 [Hirsutella rhossiliensis]KAH0964988.1 G2/mitotic-specific cyclin-4 [Hirsutella rhossiliensis]
MQARPSRPRGAENAVPLLHQRHKSTGNLDMSNASAAGIRGPAKRAAFGDVTNQSKNALGARDEAKAGKHQPALASHNAQPLGVVNKENLLYNNGGGSHNNHSKAKDSFLRPAQRPAALTAKPKTAADNRPAEVTRKPVPGASLVPGGQPGRGEAAVSRHTATDEIERALGLAASQASLEGLPFPQPRHYKSQPQLKQQPPTLRRTQSRQFEGTNAVADKAARADADPGGLPSRHLEPSADHAAYLGHLYPGPDRETLSHTPAMSEPEDCWDEDYDEEYDDQDQAYTTAHSFRSRDMTMGGVTTLLAPRVTARVQRELEEAKLEVQQTRSPEDVEEELWDVSMVAEYGEEIFDYLRELEIKMLPNPHYMEIQTEIQWSMRSVLMDWLVQVHNRFNLLPETLFLTVNYIDRFLSCKVVSIGKLQLVGATAILVASKYEEINCPSLEEIVYMVDGGYNLEEILKAERFMLSMLSFELGWPGPMSFLRRVSKADDYDLETRTLAKYFLELTIMDERFVASPPSFLAAGAHCLSRLVLSKGEWTKQHVHYSGYTWAQLKPLVTMLIECCDQPRLHHSAVYEKYKDRRYKGASTIVQRALDAGFTLPHHSIPIRRSPAHAGAIEDGSGQLPYKNGLLVSTEG